MFIFCWARMPNLLTVTNNQSICYSTLIYIELQVFILAIIPSGAEKLVWVNS